MMRARRKGDSVLDKIEGEVRTVSVMCDESEKEE